MAIAHRRVLVVEDEPLMSSLLAQVLEDQGFVVRTSANVASARREIDTFDPDLLLLDVSLGEGPTGIHLAHAVRLSRPDIAVLILTGQTDVSNAKWDGLGLPAGVGLVRKHMISDQAYLIAEIEKVLREQVDVVERDEGDGDPFAFLGATGARTLRLLAEGFDNEEIARRCGVSRKTVERRIEQVYRDLGIDTKGTLNPRVVAARRFLFAIGLPATQD